MELARGRVEAELRGDGLRVQRQRRAGERAGAERGDRRPAGPSRAAGRRRGRARARARAAGGRSSTGWACCRWVKPGAATSGCASAWPTSAASSSTSRGHDLPGVVAQVEPQVGGDLVVAAAAGAQLAAERAEPLEQAALQRGVHVLVGRRSAGTSPDAQAGSRSSRAPSMRPSSSSVEQPGAVQHPGVRAGAEQVVRREPPVEVDAHRQPWPARRPGRRRTGRPRAASVPVAHACSSRVMVARLASPIRRPSAALRGAAGRPRSRSAAILLGRPHSSTKPLASDWSKVSPAS